MHKNIKTIGSLDFDFYGWVYSISDKKVTKNNVSYLVIRCCSYKNEWMNFMIFETVFDINKLKIGQWIKMTGKVKIDNLKRHFINVHTLTIKNDEPVDMSNEIPDIESEMESVIKEYDPYDETI